MPVEVTRQQYERRPTPRTERFESQAAMIPSVEIRHFQHRFARSGDKGKANAKL